METTTKENSCDNPECQVKTQTKACTGCFQNMYCSRDCQKEHWPDHKPNCKIRRMNLQDLWDVFSKHHQTPRKIQMRLDLWKNDPLWKNVITTLKQMALSYPKRQAWSCAVCKKKLPEECSLFESTLDSGSKVVSLFLFCATPCRIKYAGHVCFDSRTCPYGPNFTVHQEVDRSLELWIYHAEHCSPWFVLSNHTRENAFNVEFKNVPIGTLMKDFCIE